MEPFRHAVPEQIRRLYALVLKENFNVIGVNVSDYETKQHGVLQKTEVMVDGYHDHDPYDYKVYQLVWLSDGTRSNYDLFYAMTSMYEQVMKQMIVPSNFLMDSATWHDISGFNK